MVELPTVPHGVLREAPLVEGDWLDRYVVALAEWGARLHAKGYELQEPEGSHPMAWYRVVDPETGADADARLLKQVWAQTQKHLATFPGCARDIQERPYLHFQDYLRRRRRKAKGDSQSGLRRGLVLAKWIRWVAANGEEGATLEGAKVSTISSYLEGCRYHICRDQDEEREERRRRESLLRDLRGWQPGSRADERYQKRIKDWKEMASGFLCDLYSLQQAADAVSQRYFDGRHLLFPAHRRGLARLVEVVEELVVGFLVVGFLVVGFNEGFADAPDQTSGPALEELKGANRSNLIGLTTLKEAMGSTTRQHATFLVDMAGAEALDALGENQAAVAILDWHV